MNLTLVTFLGKGRDSVATGYRHDGGTKDGQQTIRFVPDLPKPGRYEVRLAYTANANRATNVPVTVVLPVENYTGQCTIVDISDAEVRIRLGERDSAPAIHAGDAMIVDIRLGEAERRYSVKGSVVRSSAETCVVGLDGQIREGRLVPFSPLDLLELKAGLLNYGR